MHKCLNCGRKFEGNFCPECGERWEEPVCSECGATVGASEKFCPNCGAQLKNEVEKRKKIRTKTEKEYPSNFLAVLPIDKIYGWLRKIPSLLFALYSILLFVFFTAPVAVMPAGGDDLGGFLGEVTGERIDYGNLYSMYGNTEYGPIRGAMAAVLIFAVLSVFFAAGYLFVTFYRETGYRQISKLKLPLTEICAVVAGIILFVFFVISCVIYGKLGELDEGMGVMAGGACPALMLSFSLIFGLLAAGCYIARLVISKIFPDATRYENEYREKWETEYNQKLQAEQLAGQETAVTLVEPIEPEQVVRPSVYCDCKRYIINKRIASFLWLCDLLCCACVLLIVWLNNGLNNNTSEVLLLACLVPVAVLLGYYIVTACIPVKGINPEKLCRHKAVTLSNVISGLFCVLGIVGIALLFVSKPSGVVMVLATIGMMLLFSIECYIINFVVGLVIAGKGRKIKRAVYEFDAQTHTVVAKYSREDFDVMGMQLIKYKFYKKNLKRYYRNLALYNAGKNYNENAFISFIKAHKVLAFSVVAAILVLAVVLAFALPVALTPAEETLPFIFK